MAQIINNVFPTPNSGSAALGFSFPFSGRAVFNPTFTTREVIKTNLINWLLTNKGERVFRPNFGANLRALLWEGINEGTNLALENTIQDNIASNFPTIEVNNIQFNNQNDRNTINFILDYEIRNIGQTDQVNIELQ
jgi:phage baseplate assembly protein W|tara:strand:- start:7609 stop:8016 length:408 start_codon:yes stop_codon:yes gene_type:complete